MDKISLGKYQQVTYNAGRTLHHFAVRGFFFGVAAAKFDLKGFVSGASEKKSAVVLPAIADGDADGGAHSTLKQQNAAVQHTGVNTVNQLDKAACTFTDVANYNKAYIAYSILAHIAHVHSKQVKLLRTVDAVIPFELKMMKGSEIYEHARLMMMQAVYLKCYEDCGIHTSWRPVEGMYEDHPCILYSDDKAEMLLGMALAGVLQHEIRSLCFTVGLPRRTTLLCDESDEVANAFLVELRTAYEHHLKLQDIDETWANDQRKRSVFNKRRPGLPKLS